MQTTILFSIVHLLGTWTAAAPADMPTSSTEVYRDAFLMGSAVNRVIVSGRGTSSQEITVRPFNTITAQNVMKAESVGPRPSGYHFAPADQSVEFIERHDTCAVSRNIVLVWIDSEEFRLLTVWTL